MYHHTVTKLHHFEILQIVRPVSCLIVVDVQNDFITGSLAISNCPAGHDGLEVSHIAL